MESESHQDSIMAVRESQAGEAEPIVSETRRAQEDSSYSRVNLTKVGCQILGIEPGDDLKLEVFGDHIRVLPEESTDE